MTILSTYAYGSKTNLRQIKTLVYINDKLRTDFYVKDVYHTTGAAPGYATLVLCDPFFDSALLMENDHVRIDVDKVGTLFVGFIAEISATLGEEGVGTEYKCFDYRYQLNEVYSSNDYRIEDPVIEGRFINDIPVKNIICQLYTDYSGGMQELYTTPKFLSIDYSTFPQDANLYDQLNIRGEGIAKAMEDTLHTISNQYFLTVDYTGGESVLKCFDCYEGLRDGSFFYMEDPNYPSTTQRCNVGKIDKNYDYAEIVSHADGEGDNYKIESAIELTSGWKNVDAATIQKIVYDPERYTQKEISDDDKLTDNGDPEGKLKNPLYKREYEDVYTLFTIPPRDDRYWVNWGSGSGLFGESSAYVQYESKVYQESMVPVSPEDAEDKYIDAFIVYKKTGDTNYYTCTSGFSIVDNKYVRFNSPFVEHYPLEAYGCISGQATSYVPGSNISYFTYYDYKGTGNVTIPVGETWYLCFPDYMLSYPIAGLTYANNVGSFSVTGNIEGCGADLGNGERPFGQFGILKYNPVIYTGEAGAMVQGAANRYYVGAALFEKNELVGKILTTRWVPSTSPRYDTSLHRYKIVENTVDTIILEPTANLITDGPYWQVARTNVSYLRPYEEIWLNAVYISSRTLSYFEPDPNRSNIKARKLYTDKEYKYHCQSGYFLMAQNGLATYQTAVNVIKDETSGLTQFVKAKSAGDTKVKLTYNMELPMMDFHYKIGDRIIVNDIDTYTTVVGIGYDFVNYSTSIEGVSRQ